MRAKRLAPAMILVAVFAAACGPKEEAPDEAAAAAEQQAVAEQQARQAAREAERAALEGRISEISETIASLTGGAEGFPSDLAAEAGALGEQLSEPQELLSQLANSGDEGWEAARDRLAASLEAFEKEARATAQKAADWRQREVAALAARANMRLPIDPESGLLQGLDEGLYDPYLVSVVDRVQTELRAKGLYAGPVDGYFDVSTREAVGRFQEQVELPASGIPSPITRERLFAEAGSD